MKHFIQRYPHYFGENNHLENYFHFFLFKYHQINILNNLYFIPDMPVDEKTNGITISVGFFLSRYNLKTTNK
jgi:hypothetical protein